MCGYDLQDFKFEQTRKAETFIDLEIAHNDELLWCLVILMGQCMTLAAHMLDRWSIYSTGSDRFPPIWIMPETDNA
jgi:hypothetical protein